jgi:Trypsin-like peptidase domain/Effector-associated domain 1
MSRLTGPQIRQLREALLLAFPTDGNLKDLVLYGLDINIDRVVAPGALDDRVRDLIVWTEARGRTDEFLASAINDAPKNKLLREVAQNLRMDGGAGQFERIIRQQCGFIDVEEWRDGMIRSEQSVCRVEVNLTGQDEGVGTAFLVANDLLITNYHVMELFIMGKLDPMCAAFHFDYKLHDGKILKGSKYKLAPVWLVHSSPEDDLDFALLRLANPAGQGTLGEQQNAPVRGFLKPRTKTLASGDPLMIIQHPKAVPLKFALGTVKTLTPPTTADYVTYDVNTEDGSSGSPCFTHDWSLVALHHWGGHHHNRGILFSAILEEFDRNHICLDQ